MRHIGRMARTCAVAGLTVALAIGFVAAGAQPAGAWDPARFWDCNWKWKGWDANGELTLRYRVEAGVDEEFMTGLRTWDGLSPRIRLVRDDSNWDFRIRAVLNPWSRMAVTTRTDQYPSLTAEQLCSGWGTDMRSGGMEIVTIQNMSRYLPSLNDRRRVGAHEMGHMLSLAHWTRLITGNTPYSGYYDSIMADTADYWRMPYGPTGMDLDDVNGMYSPRIK